MVRISGAEFFFTEAQEEVVAARHFARNVSQNMKRKER
jgi:hypothetical protein